MFKFENSTAIDRKISRRGMTEKNYFGQTDIIAEFKDGHFGRVLTAKFYCSENGVVRCWLHISLPDYYAYGSGSAGGYGYDKICAAFKDALRDIGEGEAVSQIYGGESKDKIMSLIEEAITKKDGIKRIVYRNESFA